MTNETHILVVDDDEGLRDLLQKYLRKNGYRVSVEESAKQARSIMQLFRFDLLIVDVMMPEETGIGFTQSLRHSGNEVPILMLTAKGEGADRIEGLQAGVDDYLPKPFEPQELLLRIQAILRRSAIQEEVKQVHFGIWVFDLRTKQLADKDGGNSNITESEADLLYVLASSVNQPVSREDIIRLCGFSDNGDFSMRSIDAQVVRLRKKLEIDPKRPQYLMTVRNKGYLLRSKL